jgi:aminopeptidase N
MMKHVFMVLIASLLTVGALSAAPQPIKNEGDTEPDLRRDIAALTDPRFEGRGAGTEGLDLALTYLEGRFAAAGLAPLGEAGYRQPFTGPGGEALVNLIGVMGDPESGRHVIIGAHYDHLGKGEPTDANYGKIHPGADDNASGVAAMLEVARRMRADGEPAQAVVFVAFSGEEKGLLGSAYYAAHPALPLDACTAMINLDTVGRLGDGALMIFGAGTAEELPKILAGVDMGFGFTLDLPEDDPGGSDQMSFVRRGVPAVQLFTGPHADYHRPTDTPDKIDFAGLDRIAGYTTELLFYLADRDDPLTFMPPGAKAAAGGGAPAGAPATSRKVSFGSIPDFNHKGAGVLLSGVIPGSPAEQAGLAAGDLLMEFAGVEVEDLQVFSDVLKSLQPGDEAAVVYLRDGERRTATVTVVERK